MNLKTNNSLSMHNSQFFTVWGLPIKAIGRLIALLECCNSAVNDVEVIGRPAMGGGTRIFIDWNSDLSGTAEIALSVAGAVDLMEHQIGRSLRLVADYYSSLELAVLYLRKSDNVEGGDNLPF